MKPEEANMTNAVSAPATPDHGAVQPGASGGSTGPSIAAAPLVALVELVAHPLNPRSAEITAESVEELTASIGELGVLEPVLLLPAAVMVAAWAGLEDEEVEALSGGRGRPWPDGVPAGVDWVLCGGHRRVVAAAAAGLEEVPVSVRVDLAGSPHAQMAAMGAENIGREGLQPLEEARIFAALAATGWSQRRIAAANGCSPGQVAKRISLLRLPPVVLTALEDTAITVSDALELVAAETPELAAAAWSAWRDKRDYDAGTPAAAVRAVTERATQAAAHARAVQQLADEGVEVIDPHQRFTAGDWWRRQLETKTEVARARKDGTLVAAINSRGAITYFTTRTMTAPGAEREAAQRAESKERKKAIKARTSVCAQIAASPPPLPPAGPGRELCDVLAAGLLERASAETGTLAQTWLHPEPGTKPHPYQWTGGLLADTSTTGQQDRVAAAYAIALAVEECRARGTYQPWNPLTRAYLQRLQAAGYEPTAWELARLAAINDQDDAAAAAGEQAPAAGTDRAGDLDSRWLLICSAVDGWSVWADSADGTTRDLLESAGDDIGDDDVPAAQLWAAESLAGDGIQVREWQLTIDHDGGEVWEAATA